ncbi:selenide, water dikinase SelD, partial [Clostridium perfringens]
DDEPKYGLSVTGIVHPDKVLKNYGAETGDILILTKPIGLGIINTAIKAKIASKEAYEKAVKVMAYLNKYASEIITDYNITSCTDITGFSLIGHAYEMAEPSKKTFRIFKDAIPFIKEA